jgi:hypothetical protein
MKLYVSGPMTGITEFNFPAFDACEAELVAQDHEVYSPANHDREVISRLWPGKRPEDFPGYAVGDIAQYFDAVSSGGEFVLDNMMAWDLNTIVNVVDGIVLLPGWEKSSGGLAERYAAESVGKLIFEWIKEDVGDDGRLRPVDDNQLLRKTLKAVIA